VRLTLRCGGLSSGKAKAAPSGLRRDAAAALPERSPHWLAVLYPDPELGKLGDAKL